MKINLPPVEQEKTYTCLPACLRIVLHYLGTSLTEEEIANACNTTEAGTTLADREFVLYKLVDIAMSVEGILGAGRISAGLGGCISVLIEKDKTDDIRKVSEEYTVREILNKPLIALAV